MFWQHLSLSEIIEGNYDGHADGDWTVGTTFPSSKLGTFWRFSYNGSFGYFAISAENSFSNCAEIFGIDEKVDDGAPYQGEVQVFADPDDCACYTATGYVLNETNLQDADDMGFEFK